MRIPSPIAPATIAAASLFASQLMFPEPLAAISFQRYNTADDIPIKMIQQHSTVYGKVVKVIDGDTMRIRHYPLYPIKTGEKFTGKLTDNTISVRIYGVDSPEIGKFGSPSQPFAEDARDWTQKLVMDKVVQVKLLKKDQYSRIVGKVTAKKINFIPFLKTDVSLGLSKNGFATLYTGGGAEYDGNRDKLEQAILKAQKKKKGIWSNGVDDVLTPAQYKRHIKAQKSTPDFVPVSP